MRHFYRKILDRNSAFELAGGAVTAVRYDPVRPVTVYLKATRSPVEWPEVTIEANKGLITAPIYK